MSNYFRSIFLLVFTIAIHSSLSQILNEDEYDEAVRNGMLYFGVRLNSLIQSENTKLKNIVFSPVGVYAALSLLHYGSDGSTRDELGGPLGLPKSYNLFKIHETIQTYLSILHNSRPIYSLLPDLTLGRANVTRLRFTEGMFAQNGFKLKRSYIVNTKPLYGNEVINVNFQHNGQETADIINTYIEKNTQKRSSDLFRLVPPSPQTKLIVQSCSYFSSVFEVRFHKKKTKLGLFYMDNGNTSIAHMMHRNLEMPYANITSLGIQAGEMVFGDNTYSMFLVLPLKKKQTLNDLIRSFTTDTIKTIIEATAHQSEYVDLLLPRFNIKWSEMVTPHIKNLGIKEAFTEQGNFRNMVDSNSGSKVDDIGHSTYFNIMEHGTESNATKPLAHMPGLVYMEREFFHLNRPFLFFIYHKTTKTILYYGAVHDPNEDDHIVCDIKSFG